MKKVKIYLLFGLLASAVFACRKYTSIENGKGLAADMVATIDSVSWQAADSATSAIVSQGRVTISGISADGQEISITLNDTVVGLYALNQTSGSLAIYANLDSVGGYAYSTNQGADTTQAGGTVTVTSFDLTNRTITGIFDFKVYRNYDGTGKDITAGVFYNIPFSNQ
jgi:uncharacterized protein DUF6252